MLRQIQVRNLAIIPEVTVSFENGFNVFTGETGAGKSILVDAIGLLAGSRAASEVVRSGEAMAVVEGILELPKGSPVWKKMEELGLPKSGPEILLRRTVSSDGRSRAFVNDASTTVSTLSQLAPFWIDLSGQHSNQLLLSEEFHLDLLDTYAGLRRQRTEYEAAFQTVRELKKQLESLITQRAEALKQKEFLIFQSKELKEANLKLGEVEELENKHKRLANLHQLAIQAGAIDNTLREEGGSEESLGKVLLCLRALLKLDPSVAPQVENTERILSELKELSNAISKYRIGLQIEPEEIDEINMRLSLLQTVQRKYGSIAKARDELDRIESMLGLIEDSDLDEKELKQKIDVAFLALQEKASHLTKQRKIYSKKFTKEVTSELQHLGMEKAELEVALEAPSPEGALEMGDEKFGPRGAELVRIMFAPNPGEGFQPLSKIASGGELSRVLLAVKSVALSTADENGITYLFDEIDSGIGGETAERVGIRLRTLADGRQVLCVTHLAQIACYGTTHLNVEKQIKQGRTIALVSVLEEKERIGELARMTGGIQITQKTKDYAAELLGKAQSKKYKVALTGP